MAPESTALDAIRVATDASLVARAGRLEARGRALALDPAHSLDDLTAEDLAAVREHALTFARGRAAYLAHLEATETSRRLEEQRADDEAERAELQQQLAAVHERLAQVGHEAQRLAGDLLVAQAAASRLGDYLPRAERDYLAQREQELAAAEARARHARRELDSRPGLLDRLRNALGLVRRDIAGCTYSDRSWLQGLREQEGRLEGELAALEAADNGGLRAIAAQAEADAEVLRTAIAQHEAERREWFCVEGEA